MKAFELTISRMRRYDRTYWVDARLIIHKTLESTAQCFVNVIEVKT